MTTPHQGLPDTVETMLGTGAYEIGGAGTDFGQAVDESVVTNLFRIPNPTEANKVDVFEQALTMLPADSLAAFEPVIPDFDPADTPDNWITQLLESLFPRTTPDDVGEDLVESIINMWNEWFGISSPDPDGVPEEVAQVFESIRAAVAGGFTLQTFTSSDAAWAVPPELAIAVEAYAFAVGGGGKGSGGATTTSSGVTLAGGAGGRSGGYISEQIDPGTLGATLNVTIGAAATTNNTDGGVSSIVNGGTTLVASVADVGAMATVQGYAPTNSLPAVGGRGGDVDDSPTAADGESNAFATGGAGGGGVNNGSGHRTGTNGSSGGTGQITETPLTGGAGGGGGGAASSSTVGGNANGGNGGLGGFPGGGGGGGGGAHITTGTATQGNAGTPGNGFAALLWK